MILLFRFLDFELELGLVIRNQEKIANSRKESVSIEILIQLQRQKQSSSIDYGFQQKKFLPPQALVYSKARKPFSSHLAGG